MIRIQPMILQSMGVDLGLRLDVTHLKGHHRAMEELKLWVGFVDPRRVNGIDIGE